MNKRYFDFIAHIGIVMILTLFMGCTSEELTNSDSEGQINPIGILIKDSPNESKALMDFYLKITRESCASTDSIPQDNNVIISPYGIMNLLGMALHEVSPEYQKSLLDYIGVSETGELDMIIHNRTKEITKLRSSYEKINNSWWTKSPTPDNNKVEDIFEEYYNSKINYFYSVEEEPELFNAIINAWCKENSNGLIAEIPFQDEEILQSLLLNCTYVEGSLLCQEEEVDHIFYGSAGDKNVKMFCPTTQYASFFQNEEFNSFGYL